MFYEVVLDWGPSKFFKSHTKAVMYLFRSYVESCDNSPEDDVQIATAWRELVMTDAIDCFGTIYAFKFEDDDNED